MMFSTLKLNKGIGLSWEILMGGGTVTWRVLHNDVLDVEVLEQPLGAPHHAPLPPLHVHLKAKEEREAAGGRRRDTREESAPIFPKLC